MTRGSLIIIILILLSLGGTFIFHKELSENKMKYQNLLKENSELKKNYERCSGEYASILEDYNRILRKELVKKYLDYVVNMDEATADGYTFKESDRETIKERIDFILENMALLELDKEKSFQYLSFLASMQKRLKK